MFTYKDLIRINVGGAFPPYHLPGEKVFRVTLIGSVSTALKDFISGLDIELGAYYGYSASRRPYGIMIGLIW